MGETESPFEWEDFPDLTVSSEEELKDHLQSLVIKEAEVSYRRRVLQGRIDLLRAELVRRGKSSVSAGELAQALIDGVGDADLDDPRAPGSSDSPGAPDETAEYGGGGVGDTDDPGDRGKSGREEWRGP
ncbi:RsiG family protein [Rubrobacter aplysinae]|uniref:RsiG family protein n=1 Tax=Rubrobacter aplysinae TaxID=909625 RepID=UPI00069EEF07|nr:hypothetical protein [Rubrobacter aplysinae]